LDRPHGLENRNQINFFIFILGVPAGQHGASADDNGRDIEPCRCHEHTGNDFVAIGHQDQGVKGMGHGRHLNGIGDEFPGRQGIVHAFVVHGNPVTDADGGKLHGSSPGHADAGFDGFDDIVQVHVPGNQFIGRVGNADQGAGNFMIRIAHGLHQASVGGSGYPLCCNVASHIQFSPKLKKPLSAFSGLITAFLSFQAYATTCPFSRRC